MTKNLLILFSICAFAIVNSCRKSPKDSHEINDFTANATYVNELNDSSWECSSYDFDESINLANKAINISKEINYKSGIATGHNRIGLAYDYKGDYKTALEYYLIALNLHRSNNDSVGMSKTLNNIGTSFYCQSNYLEAQKYYLQSLEIREKTNDLEGIAQSYNNIGLLFRVQKNYDKAIESYKNSIRIRTQLNDKKGIMYAQQNLGVAYERINKIDSAIFYYNEALNSAIELGDSLTIASNLTNLCMANKYQGHYSKAINQATEAEKILRKINNQHTLAYSLASFGEVYVEIKDYPKAISYISESLEFAKLLNRQELVQSCYHILSNIHSQIGEYKQAYKYHKLYSSVKDSIINENTNNQLNEIQTKYETVKKEKQIVKLTQENLVESQRKSLFLGIAVFLLLSSIIIALLLTQHKLKSKQQEAILKQKMLRSQMNPHFIFNALGSIQSFVFYKKTDEAVNYLSKFSDLMRDILEGSINDYIPVEQDISIVENYLLLQKLRHENKFTYTITADEDLFDQNIPPMLTQPFIENSIKHGIQNIEYQGEIKIVYRLDGNYLIIEIIDNGKGFYSSNSTTKKHNSYAISLTKQRLQLVGKDCTVKIISPIINNKNGTKIVIRIKSSYI